MQLSSKWIHWYWYYNLYWICIELYSLNIILRQLYRNPAAD